MKALSPLSQLTSAGSNSSAVCVASRSGQADDDQTLTSVFMTLLSYRALSAHTPTTPARTLAFQIPGK